MSSMAELRVPNSTMMLGNSFSISPRQTQDLKEAVRLFSELQRTVIVPQETFLKLDAASTYIPKENPRKPRGEDAHFIYREKQTIGVADGVGGWTKEGIDSGEYARQLMTNSILALLHQERKGGQNDTIINPKRILQEAFKNTNARGSSTACIITLSGNRLMAANVGDSGFLVIRKGRVMFQSPTQQHGFNCPYQLGSSRDDLSKAQEIELFVESGDVVVAGTDGFLDNMHLSEVEEVLREKTRQGVGLDEISSYMANLALYNSFDKYADTPYSVAAKKAGIWRQGGKVDDITVIIARIHS